MTKAGSGVIERTKMRLILLLSALGLTLLTMTPQRAEAWSGCLRIAMTNGSLIEDELAMTVADAWKSLGKCVDLQESSSSRATHMFEDRWIDGMVARPATWLGEFRGRKHKAVRLLDLEMFVVAAKDGALPGTGAFIGTDVAILKTDNLAPWFIDMTGGRGVEIERLSLALPMMRAGRMNHFMVNRYQLDHLRTHNMLPEDAFVVQGIGHMRLYHVMAAPYVGATDDLQDAIDALRPALEGRLRSRDWLEEASASPAS